MVSVLEIAYEVITPIFLIVGLVAWFGKRFQPEPRTLSTITLYLFAPFLVFQGMATTEIEASGIGRIALVMGFFTVIMLGVGWVLLRFQHLERKTESAFLLTVILLNAANYGVPLNEFAFGEEALPHAILIYVMSAVIASTVGVYLASRGSISVQGALLNVFRIPLMYAAVLGLVVNFGHIQLPLPLERSVGILSQAAIPAMLVVLGLQLSSISMERARTRLTPVLLSAVSKLMIAALVAVFLAELFGLSGLSRKVTILQLSTPTAVMTGVLATEFDSDAEFATAAILVSTLASIITLSILIALLK